MSLPSSPARAAIATAVAPLLLLTLAVASAFGQPRPFTIHDLVAMDRIAEPAVSPDGTRVAFVVSALDLEANRRRTDLWIVGTDGSGLRRLTNHPASDTSPVWAPDGRSVFFLSSRSGSSQVWRVPVDGGEPQPVTSLPLDVGSFALSRDGRLLAVSLEVFPDCATLACTADRLKAAEATKATGRLYDRLFIRHWDTWKDGRRSHLFVVPAGGSAGDGSGGAVDIMKGMDADAPPKPFGGAEEFTFTPDGRSVVFTARIAGTTEPWSTNFDLFVAPVDASARPHNLTAPNPAWDTGPVFSPDGRTLAYRAMVRPGYESDRLRIVLRPWPDGEPRMLTEGWDRSPDTIVWSADGRTIYTTADHLGQKGLFAIDTASGAVRTVIGEGHVTSPAVAGDRLVVSIDHLRSPAELHTVRPDGSGLAPITRVNAERLAAVAFGEPEQFTFKGWNDETVYAWIVKPAGFDPSRRYPIAFLIHGGPQGSFSNNFHYRWNPQVYAGAGYAVVMVDFHGSTGYGQAFTDSIRGDWGGKPLEDLQKGLDAALARAPWMDGSRACALGASYGGYMINWIAGMWPDRFRCLVNHDGDLDERFAYYATEELWFPEWEHGGTPWDNPAGYAKHNPIDHVAKWKTPMLVIHGARDYRVVDTQGIATFTALQRRGIPSRFLYFPDENHWVLKPANSIQWHETVLEWLARWTK
jgi:dipeptidyl aminopeptidase/acylaminoacyl peptidase